PRASDTASCLSQSGTGRASLVASGHRIGAIPEAAMARLSSAAWDCPPFSSDTPPPRMSHISHDPLAAPGDLDVLDNHFLPAAPPHIRQRIHLSGECSL